MIAEAPEVPENCGGIWYEFVATLEGARMLLSGSETVDAAAEARERARPRARRQIELAGTHDDRAESTKVGDPGRVCARSGKTSRDTPPFPAGSITVMPRSVARPMAPCTAGSNSSEDVGIVAGKEGLGDLEKQHVAAAEIRCRDVDGTRRYWSRDPDRDLG